MILLPKNIHKNSSQLIQINQTSIQQTKTTKFLGVLVDQKMNWDGHIQNDISK